MVRKRSCYCDTKLASHEGRLLNIVRADNLYEISTLYNEMPKLRVKSSLNNFVTLPFVQPRSIPHNGHLGQLTLLPFLSQLLVFMSANKTQKKNFHANCKVIPGSPDWLSDYSWPALNRTLGGRLFKPTPPGAVCHPDQPTFNAAIFPTVQAEWLTAVFHTEDPASGVQENWSNDTCLPYANDACSGEGYPVYVINTTHTEDINHGIDFAEKHNIRLVVNATGHDYMGIYALSM